MKAAGADPDDCFYIQNAELIIGREDLNLKHDPPPNLVVEIDRTSSSPDRFAIYAALGVPEIWRLARRQVRIHLLSGDRYQESLISGAFPFLTAQAVSEFVARGLKEGERKVAVAFREWVRQHHNPSQ